LIFPDKIRAIKSTDRVLEIGPGALPHERSDVFLEIAYENDEERKRQSGDQDKIELQKPVVYYDGGQFPFSDNEFDYIICSHVIEHVDNVEAFLEEMFRVAKRGYIEYPTILYEYLYGFDVHVNFVKYRHDRLVFLKKSKTQFNSFVSVQRFFLAALEKGYTHSVNELKQFMFEGFEWDAPFRYEETGQVQDVMWEEYEIPTAHSSEPSLLREIIKLIPFSRSAYRVYKKLRSK
jgi:SAM-dependent methyltransferase